MLEISHQRILVTGGAGFLGRAVCAELVQAGAAPDHIFVPRRAVFDLTREEAVEEMYARLRPTLVIHLAAEVGGIGANLTSPGRFFYANMAMGLHMIEHARQSGVAKFVQIGTVCAYPKYAATPFREDDLWNGYPEETNAPYGIAKKALHVMLDAYRRQYGLCGVYLLPVNLYGPGDNFELSKSHVIPALMRRFHEASVSGAPRVDVWGSGTASREFLYVEDCARGVVAAAKTYDGGQPVNLGSGEEITIRALAEKIRALAGFKGEITWDATKPDGQPRRRLDTSRAAALLGWRSQIGLDEGLQRTMDWYRSHIAR